jgi:hypothetical protein
MHNCQHFKRIGDNYGLSCQTCGQPLEGFGFGGFFGSSLTGNEQCIHVWEQSRADGEECKYCYIKREQVMN